LSIRCLSLASFLFADLSCHLSPSFLYLPQLPPNNSNSYNKIIVKMVATLADIQRAIRGEVLMSAELDEQYVAMDQNKVPANWANVAYPSLKPLASWITDLIKRINFMRTWLVNGPPNTFWMGGFYFPQGFMTGASQNHARKYKIAIDSLRWAFEVKRMETADDVQDGALLCVFVL